MVGFSYSGEVARNQSNLDRDDMGECTESCDSGACNILGNDRRDCAPERCSFLQSLGDRPYIGITNPEECLRHREYQEAGTNY